MRVLVTRAEPGASVFADLCRANGHTPVLAPVMEIEIYQQPVDVSGAGALAFTSANGVRAFAANEERRDLVVFAVGAVTAEAAVAAGFKNIKVAEGDVQSLAAHIEAERAMASNGVLHIAGDDRAGDLVALLASAGIRAERLTLYKARALKALPAGTATMIKTNPPEWASFFSPRSARLFLELAESAGVNSALKSMNAACLSEAVADAAGDIWRKKLVSPGRNAESLVKMIAAQKDMRA
ncbi:uroporphyrinogen-III synthase [Hyphococcus flavus]|uniref:Uroporphyrinogen-III synthase n=1 Tax=Hyphococcus flavus TaxID=1866326 RepID=A0AAF0CGW5_9PROT|nr:uroporphyrinogen-III synthase [Hyphococcus flavus]WDI32939.1 uroporphyrinogen-III synthase [Hyphococcus flavus]